jgi:hypothetical protein
VGFTTGAAKTRNRELRSAIARVAPFMIHTRTRRAPR